MSVRALARKRNAKEESFSRQSVLSGTEVHHVDVSAKPDVISQIPARIIRISVDHDVVGIPQPVGAVVEVIGRDAPEKSVELEPRRATANEAIDVTATDVTGEMTVLPRMSEVIVRARAAADPLAGGGMNVRRGGMARPVIKSRMLVALRRMSGSRGLADMRGTAGRDVAVADLLGGARCRVRGRMRSLWVLCGKRAEQTQEQSCCDSDEFFHDTPPGLALHTTPLRGMESRSFVERAHWPKGPPFFPKRGPRIRSIPASSRTRLAGQPKWGCCLSGEAEMTGTFRLRPLLAASSATRARNAEPMHFVKQR